MNKRAVSLVETVVVMTIFAIVMLGTYKIIELDLKYIKKFQQESMLQQEAIKILIHLNKHLKDASYLTHSAGRLTLFYQNPSSGKPGVIAVCDVSDPGVEFVKFFNPPDCDYQAQSNPEEKGIYTLTGNTLEYDDSPISDMVTNFTVTESPYDPNTNPGQISLCDIEFTLQDPSSPNADPLNIKLNSLYCRLARKASAGQAEEGGIQAAIDYCNDPGNYLDPPQTLPPLLAPDYEIRCMGPVAGFDGVFKDVVCIYGESICLKGGYDSCFSAQTAKTFIRPDSFPPGGQVFLCTTAASSGTIDPDVSIIIDGFHFQNCRRALEPKITPKDLTISNCEVSSSDVFLCITDHFSHLTNDDGSPKYSPYQANISIEGCSFHDNALLGNNRELILLVVHEESVVDIANFSIIDSEFYNNTGYHYVINLDTRVPDSADRDPIGTVKMHNCKIRDNTVVSQLFKTRGDQNDFCITNTSIYDNDIINYNIGATNIIYVRDSINNELLIKNCFISNNTVKAIDNPPIVSIMNVAGVLTVGNDISSGTIENCVISDNSFERASTSSGILNFRGNISNSINFTNLNITNNNMSNSADRNNDSKPDGMSYAGIIYFVNDISGNLEFDNCEISKNFMEFAKDNVSIIRTERESLLKINNTKIIGNIICSGTKDNFPADANSAFKPEYVAVIFVDYDPNLQDYSISNSVIAENEILYNYSDATANTSLLYFRTSALTDFDFSYVTMVDNKVDTPMIGREGFINLFKLPADAQISDSIIYGNMFGHNQLIYSNSSTNLTISYADMQTDKPTNATIGSGMQDIEPIFVNPDSDNYKIKEGVCLTASDTNPAGEIGAYGGLAEGDVIGFHQDDLEDDDTTPDIDESQIGCIE